MDVTTLRDVLLWCAVINYGVLVLWFLAFLSVRDRMHERHSRWFRLSAEQFDAVHYLSMALYKLGILLFNIVPWIALHIVEIVG